MSKWNPLQIGYVYLIQIENENLYKIGRSTDVQRRYAELNTSYPYNLILVYSKKLHHHTKVEKKLHKLYRNKRVSGEWFRLMPIEVDDIIRYLTSAGVGSC